MNFIPALTVPSFKVSIISTSPHHWAKSFTALRSSVCITKHLSAKQLDQPLQCMHSCTLRCVSSASVCTQAYPCVCAAFCSTHHCQQAMSDIPSQDPCRDTRNDVSACSSSHSAMPAGLSYHIEENITYDMAEKGAQLMLQQHLHHYGVLTVSEQQRWKQPIITDLGLHL